MVPAIQWYEGMLLAPQHFQQQELRWHQLMSIHLNHLSTHHWGVIDLEFDPITLPTGLLRILNLKAIMPDGLVVTHLSMPDALPLELDLTLAKQQIMDMGQPFIWPYLNIWMAFPPCAMKRRGSGLWKGGQ